MPSYLTIYGPFTVSSLPTVLFPSFLWCLGPVQNQKESSMPVETILTTEQRIRATATPVTPAGNPAVLDGPVVYTVESGTCTLQSMLVHVEHAEAASLGVSLGQPELKPAP